MFKHYRFKRTQFFTKKGVYPSYATMMEHMCSGPCLALLVTSSAASKFDEFDVVERFRALSGPLEPDVARRYEPRTTSPQYFSNHHPRMRHNIIVDIISSSSVRLPLHDTDCRVGWYLFHRHTIKILSFTSLFIAFWLIELYFFCA